MSSLGTQASNKKKVMHNKPSTKAASRFPGNEVYPPARNTNLPAASDLSGGLALFYMDDLDVKILYSNKRMIGTEARIEGRKVNTTFTDGKIP
ncbi:unnamed protein product [Microthlaspi erraticum]|uniref:Uncharacterized protein n=1 Tax=Microthlaspi erraticum TaxID=1685480 RepID=A0A6D2L5G2_9BRAS|nr:unnamed protein product [Microthlaspi erraticum]